jgi:hypothetical protein
MVDALMLAFSLGVAVAFLVVIFKVPELQVEPDEHVILQSKAALTIDTLLGSTMGSVYLTNRRIVWRRAPWFLGLLSASPPSQSFLLSQITEVTGGTSDRGWWWKFSRDATERRMMAFMVKLAIDEHECFVRFFGVNPFRLLSAPKQWKSAIKQALITAANSEAEAPSAVLMPSKLSLGIVRAFMLFVSVIFVATAVAFMLISFSAGDAGDAAFAALFALVALISVWAVWQLSIPRGKARS